MLIEATPYCQTTKNEDQNLELSNIKITWHSTNVVIGYKHVGQTHFLSSQSGRLRMSCGGRLRCSNFSLPCLCRLRMSCGGPPRQCCLYCISKSKKYFKMRNSPRQLRCSFFSPKNFVQGNCAVAFPPKKSSSRKPRPCKGSSTSLNSERNPNIPLSTCVQCTLHCYSNTPKSQKFTELCEPPIADLSIPHSVH